MSRFLTLLAGRNSQNSLAADGDAQDALSELQRKCTFRDTLNEFQQKFVEEERDRAAGEQARKNEFCQMMAEHDGIFETKQQHRESSFLEADARQEETFQKNESGRQALFLEGQNSRAATFERFQAFCAEHSAWHGLGRETLLLQGRQARKEYFATIDAALVDQFVKLLKIAEDSFAVEEERKNRIVKQLLEDNTAATPTSPGPNTVGSVRPLEAVALKKPLSLVLPATAPVSIPRSSQKQIRGPRSPILHAPIPTHLPDPLSDADIPLQQRQPSCPCHEAPSHHPIDLTLCSASIVDETDGPDVCQLQNIGDPPDQFSGSAEQERQQTFAAQEMEREDRFQAAEAIREQAEGHRTKDFMLRERHRLTKFHDLLESHEERFREREATRNEGDIRRDAMFKATQKRQSHAFDTSLSQAEKQAKAENILEENIIKHMKSMAQSLNQKQIDQLEAARGRRLACFRAAQRYRDGQLGVLLHLRGTIRGGRNIPSLSAISSRLSGVPAVSPVLSSLRRRRPSPPGGFAVAALFRGNSVQDPLPVPVSSGFHEELHLETMTQHLRRGPQYIFEQAQAGREEAFGKGAWSRRHIFDANEVRRRAEFEKKQRSRHTTFEENEDGHDDFFKRAQKQRQTSFRTAEREREIEFLRNESAKDRLFRQAQEERERFHAELQELQTNCLAAEQRRFLEIEAWGAQLLEGREREQMRLYKNEKQAREDVFQKSLEASRVKYGGA